MEEMVLHIYLGYGALRDGITKKIPVWYLLSGLLLSAIFTRIEKGIRLENIILSLVPGGIFLIYSLIKKEGLGLADGIMLCILGIWLSLNIWRIWYLSLVIIGMFSGILLLLKKVTPEKRLPYYPFLYLAYLLYQGGNYV